MSGETGERNGAGSVAGSRVVIANPGGQRHLRDVAAAFAEVGALERYISTVGFGSSDIERLERRLPKRLADRVGAELKRRAVEDAVGDRSTRTATAWEIFNVMLARSPLPKPVRYSGHRPARVAFDRNASRLLERGTDAVIGSQGTATTIFRRARELGIATVLDYPIAHYTFTERVLEEEARLVPEYADTIRVRTFPDWVKRRYAEEIATADRIVMVSADHQQNFAEAGIDPARTFIVPWYVNSELFTPPEHPEDRVFRVAFMGELSQRKGLSYLIDGFERAGLPDAELVLIGRAHARGPWLGKDRVRHVGALAHFALPEVLRGCHVTAMPSLVEGFPVSVLEGMACGLPAIVSENIGRSIVADGEDGFVVPIRDPEAIAERLRQLHDDTQLRGRMSLAARAKAETFTRERNHEALREGVGELLAERRGPGGTRPERAGVRPGS